MHIIVSIRFPCTSNLYQREQLVVIVHDVHESGCDLLDSKSVAEQAALGFEKNVLYRIGIAHIISPNEEDGFVRNR